MEKDMEREKDSYEVISEKVDQVTQMRLVTFFFSLAVGVAFSGWRLAERGCYQSWIHWSNGQKPLQFIDLRYRSEIKSLTARISVPHVVDWLIPNMVSKGLCESLAPIGLRTEGYRCDMTQSQS